MESPERTVRILSHLVSEYGADSVQFYDMNFFLREDHARELADRLAPLNLRWWCEARVDIMARYSDATLEAVKRAGCTMIFFGAESGSDWVLKAVSYTHLDVYKRQPRRCARAASESRSSASRVRID